MVCYLQLVCLERRHGWHQASSHHWLWKLVSYHIFLALVPMFVPMICDCIIYIMYKVNRTPGRSILKCERSLPVVCCLYDILLVVIERGPTVGHASDHA